MKFFLRIVLCLVIILFGTLCIRQMFGGITLGIVFGINYMLFGFLVISVIVALALDTTFYKLNRNIFQYSSSVLGLLFCATLVSKIFKNNSIEKSTTIYYIKSRQGAESNLEFELKTNNAFTLTTLSLFSQNRYYGSYLKNNDTIKILKSNYNGILPTFGNNRNDTIFWDNFDTMLIEKNTHPIY